MLVLVKKNTRTDLRGAVRFPLQLPVAVHGKDKAVTGLTQDISAGGVLIHCDEDYPVGSTIQFSISLPAQTLAAAQDVHVECTGRVVRCSPVGDQVAVAAIIDEYRITR